MGANVKPALVIMAAGIGSRYGGGIKQHIKEYSERPWSSYTRHLSDGCGE